MHLRKGSSRAGAVTSHALVCQLSIDLGLGNQPGNGIRRYSERTLMYGSYISRNSERVFSSPGSLRSTIPISPSASLRRVSSSVMSRSPPNLTGDVLKTWARSTTAWRVILKVNCACHFGTPSMPTITRLHVSKTVLSADSHDWLSC